MPSMRAHRWPNWVLPMTRYAKTSEKDELGDEDLMQPSSRARVIITKQALQEVGIACLRMCAVRWLPARGSGHSRSWWGALLRMPQVARTAYSLAMRAMFYHNATTGEVVRAIKQSLESEGMGDLVSTLQLTNGDDQDVPKPDILKRPRRVGTCAYFLAYRDVG